MAKGKKKVSKKMGEILKAPKKAEKAVKAAVEKYVNKTHWDTKDAFIAAVNASGVHPDAINVNAEWDLYQSDREGYRNPLKLEK